MNESIVLFLNSFTGQTQWFDTLVIFFAEVLIVIMPIVLVYHFYTVDDKRDAIRDIFIVLFAAIFAWGIADFAKYYFASDRPFVVLADVTALMDNHFNAAFPSGHTAFTAALAVAVTYFHRKTGAVLIVLSLLIGISRIIAGVHWPIDILGGFFLGTTISVTLLIAYEKYVESRRLFGWVPWNK